MSLLPEPSPTPATTPSEGALRHPTAISSRLRALLTAAPLPPRARAFAEVELERLAELPPGSEAAAAIASRLEWAAELPWRPAPIRSLPTQAEARAMLDESHVGRGRAKQRVLEMLAVQTLTGRPASGHLCLAGPPGVGKTSFARSLARVLGRPALWIPAGAVTEESELFGSPFAGGVGQPGAVLEGLRNVACSDPVLILDELDALELGGAGESISPLLQLFDADLAGQFTDRFLGLPFDLSRCLIIATAEEPEDLSEALADRLEVLEFSSYSRPEKLRIGAERLLPAVCEDAGLSAGDLSLTKTAWRRLVAEYTEEAGVRQLERRLRRLARHTALNRVRGGSSARVRGRDLPALLGAPRIADDAWSTGSRVGVVLGLSWTSAGGAPLPIEVATTPGAARALITGQLGEVMRESVQTATTWIKTELPHYGLPADLLETLDLHVHCPAAAIPKDGPSAGLAIAVAIASRLSGRPARGTVALTGEISLLGQVLGVGGLREKLLAAARAGAAEIVLPAANGPEIERLTDSLAPGMRLHLVQHVRQAIEKVLLPAPRSKRG